MDQCINNNRKSNNNSQQSQAGTIPSMDTANSHTSIIQPDANNSGSADTILSHAMSTLPKHLPTASIPPPLSSAASTTGPNQPHHPVAEFLYQLTKMLTDDNNEIIEWVEGRIKVHFPERLESEVLHKYFRHSKFASFQRQLNYFGFRKIAGKGKMSPCSYVNESATSDIRSLLLIKRKTNGSAARKAMAQRALNLGGGGLNPAGFGCGIGLPVQVPNLTTAPGFGTLGGSVGLSTVGQQLKFQKQLGIGLIENNTNNNVLSQLLIQNQQRQSREDFHQLSGLKSTVPSIEQLQAQIANLTKQQSQGGANVAFNAAHALNLASGGSATAALNFPQFQQFTENPATAALNATANAVANPFHPSAMPATAAMNSNVIAGQTNNLFESAANLKALIGNDLVGNNDSQKALGAAGSALNNLIPNGASMGNLLASSNRLSSLLSLNSFLSREPSLADLAMIPNMNSAAQFAAFHQQQATAVPHPATMSNDMHHQSANNNNP